MEHFAFGDLRKITMLGDSLAGRAKTCSGACPKYDVSGHHKGIF